MHPKTLLRALLPVLLIAMPVPHLAQADEGMWTFDNFPAALVRERLGVEITPAWLERVRLSTVRLSNCTASFVSAEGLILTNHHCVRTCLEQLSSPGEDLLHGGFLVAERSAELRCPTQRADVLMATRDITTQVNAAVAGLDDRAANEARKQALTRLEQSCEQAAGTRDPRRCEAVTLYGGGQYFLYLYKRYDDVRLVFAPENAIAAFGGDPDNFQFPRWSLDMALLRAYENGAPARVPAHLKIDWNGPAAGDAVFVPGHPGSTQRLLTVAQYEAARAQLPFWLQRAGELRGRYIQFATTGTESRRIVQDALFSVENNIKVRRQRLDALLDPALLAQKRAAEESLRARTTLPAGASDPWQDIERAMAIDRQLHVPHTFIEGAAGFNSALFSYARTLVRGAAERAKPNESRLREFVDTALPRLEQQLLADVPVYAAREQLTLSFGLERMREYLGPDYPLVRNLLTELSPEELAAGLVQQTRLGDAGLRRQLWEGGQAAIDASGDPMIRIARLIDGVARALRKQYEDEVEAVVTAASARIAAARFAALGTTVYPDATFTLRLNFGSVQGWNEAGAEVLPFTTLARAFERATGADPFRLPDSWLAQRNGLDPGTRFNLVTTNDIIGGNSGSPLLNARGEIVGLVFDGNIHAIAGAYWVDPAVNRAVSVHPAIMRVALTQVYPAAAIARELGLP
ncbi:MAG TPA: S46 family peptidase [Steroidobacteraceae bacterium]|nr:S46 family peptidase [Steroidobacteraceae bacterium]